MKVLSEKEKVLLERYKKPAFKGVLTGGDVKKATENVGICGDLINVYVRVENGKIKDAKYNGYGCMYCMGTADLLMQNIIGKSVSDAKKLEEKDIIKIIGFVPEQNRRVCINLALNALKKAIG